MQVFFLHAKPRRRKEEKKKSEDSIRLESSAGCELDHESSLYFGDGKLCVFAPWREPSTKCIIMLESVTTLPFNRHVGIQKSTSGDGLLELPPGDQFLNHLGTVHAGAQLALAEACSGEYLLQALAKEAGVIPVVRRVEAKFKKPANGKVIAKINATLTAIDEAIIELTNKGRCLLSIYVDVYDEEGKHSLSSSFEWFITRAPKQ